MAYAKNTVLSQPLCTPLEYTHFTTVMLNIFLHLIGLSVFLPLQSLPLCTWGCWY